MKHRIGNETQTRELLLGLRSGVTIPRLFKCNTSIGVLEPVHEGTMFCELTIQALRLLRHERYRDGIYSIRVTKHGKKLELTCEMELAGCSFASDTEEADAENENENENENTFLGNMVDRIYNYLGTDTLGSTVLSRNMVDDEADDDADDEADICHQPVLQFVISKTRGTDKQLKIGISTLVNRITDRTVSTDVKGVCIASCLEAPELSTPGTYEVSVRCRLDVDSDKVGVKLTIVRLPDDHRFGKHHGSTTIGAVREKSSLGEILDYLQDKLSDDIISETNLGDQDDQADLIGAIRLLA